MPIKRGGGELPPSEVVEAQYEATQATLEKQEELFKQQLVEQEAKAIEDFLKQRAGPEARQKFQEQLDTEMQEETQRFEAELAEKRAEQERQFAQEMSSADIEARKTFTSQLQESAQIETQRFEKQLEDSTHQYKRQFAQTHGKHPTPRQVRAWQQPQRKQFQSSLDVWGKEQWTTFFYGLEPWYKKEQAKFETSQKEWEAKAQEQWALDLPKWEKEQWGNWRVWAESGSEIEADLKAYEAEVLKPWKAEATSKFESGVTEFITGLETWKTEALAQIPPVEKLVTSKAKVVVPHLGRFKADIKTYYQYYEPPPTLPPSRGKVGGRGAYAPILTGESILDIAMREGGVLAATSFLWAGVKPEEKYPISVSEVIEASQPVFVPVQPSRKDVLKDIMKQPPFGIHSPATIIFESVPALKEFQTSVKEKGAVMTLMEGIEQVWGEKAVRKYPYLGLLPPIEERRLAVKGVAEFLLGPLGTVESLIRPSVPTVSGAVLEPLLFGKTTQAEFLAKHPTYALGEAVGEYLFGKYVVAPVVEKAWAIAPKAVKAPVGKVGAKLWEKMPERLKGLFVEEKQVSYWAKETVEEPSWMRAMKLEKLAHEKWLGKYRPTYKLLVEGKARAFVESTKIPSGIVHTPYATTLEKVIGGPSTTVVTSGTQKLLLKTGTVEVTKQLPKLTLQKTYPTLAKQVVKQVPKIAYKQLAKTILKPTALSKLITQVSPLAIPSLVRYAGLKAPSKFAVKNVWGEVAKLKPYPQKVEPTLKIKSASEIISIPSTKPTPKIISKSRIETIHLPKTVPSIAPLSVVILGTKQEVGLLQEHLQVQVQELVQVQKEVSIAKLIQAEGFIAPKSPLITPPRKRKKWAKRKAKKVKKPLFGQYELLYPVATESEAAQFILGKSHGKVSVADAVYGKRKRR